MGLVPSPLSLDVDTLLVMIGRQWLLSAPPCRGQRYVGISQLRHYTAVASPTHTLLKKVQKAVSDSLHAMSIGVCCCKSTTIFAHAA